MVCGSLLGAAVLYRYLKLLNVVLQPNAKGQQLGFRVGIALNVVTGVIDTINHSSETIKSHLGTCLLYTSDAAD
ncbi:MAG: hypothetical protein EBZ77_03525, partial [Chitinophagia bacterium]|nr:hypothetical protein [Chitinophagia bacterium]